MPGPYLIDDNVVPNTACRYALQRKVVRDFDGHFHCVYSKNVTVDIVRVHPFYSKSTDLGITWSNPLDLMPGSAEDHSFPSIIVAPDGTIHVVFQGPPHYLKCKNGIWSSPQTISVGFLGQINVNPPFIVGEEVEGETSGTLARCIWYLGAGVGNGRLGVDNPDHFVKNEWIRGNTSGKRLKWENDSTNWILGGIAINSSQIQISLHISNVFLIVPRSATSWNHGSMTEIGTGAAAFTPTGPAIGSNNLVHIVAIRANTYEHVCGSWGGWTSKYDICPAATANWQYPAIAIDLSGNLYVVMAQTGLGGTNPGTLNIKLYKRDRHGTWTGPEHVTDEAVQCIEPTIAVDKNGIITIVFLSRLGGLGNDAIFMRQKIGNSWNSIETLIERTFREQEEINLLHSLWPARGSFRPNYSDGYAFIFNGYIDAVPAYYTVEFYHDLHVAIGWPPTDLHCEQKTNPDDVEDPFPEFSAIYHETK